MILTNIFNFNNKVATMDPMQVLVTPLPSGIHYRKRITITASSYAGSHIIPIFLCGGGPTILTKAWRLLQSRKKYEMNQSALAYITGCTRSPHKKRQWKSTAIVYPTSLGIQAPSNNAVQFAPAYSHSPMITTVAPTTTPISALPALTSSPTETPSPHVTPPHPLSPTSPPLDIALAPMSTTSMVSAWYH